MPLNTLRLNQKQLHPNDRITFIKPLPNLSSTFKAELFLQKIAAQCYPIMRAHSLSITTLEEFAPNREFMGRNFNGGEVIQLVLRRMPIRRWDQGRQGFVSRSDLGENGVVVRGNQGRLDPHSTEFVAERDGQDEGWLSFRAVQAVMMHELAHCIEMNHSKAFWKVRNIYMDHLKILWREGYLGEGMWGRGQHLQSGGFDGGSRGNVEDFDGLCGGAYRGRGRKRGKKAREKVSYAERKKRKLEQTEGKFGKGQNVGENESMKVALEGKFKGSKPRVANSKRGRELRAAAALARFDVVQRQTDDDDADLKTDENDIETESEEETDSGEDDGGSCLVDAKGTKVKDAKGNDLYKVCEDGDATKDEDARNELDELEELVYRPNPQTNSTGSNNERQVDFDTGSNIKLGKGPTQTIKQDTRRAERLEAKGASTDTTMTRACPICSLENEASNATCIACAHVLRRDLIPGSWECPSEGCKASGYVNVGDAGVCGVCGRKKA